MKTIGEFNAAKVGDVIVWFVYYNDDDTLCCITADKHRADAYKQMNYTVKEVKKS